MADSRSLRRNRRFIAASLQPNCMSHRAFFGVLRDLLKARNAPFSFPDLACGDAACTVRTLRRTKVSDYIAVDLAEPALSAASVTPVHSVRYAGRAPGFSGVCKRSLPPVGHHFYRLLISPLEQQSQISLRISNSSCAQRGGRMDFLRTGARWK
jgi:hypothetical protein